MGVVADAKLLPALTVLWLRERGIQGSSRSLQGLCEGELPPCPGRVSCRECCRDAIRLSLSTCPLAWAPFLGIRRRESVREGGSGGFLAFFREMCLERALSGQEGPSPGFLGTRPSKTFTTLCLGSPKPLLLWHRFPGPAHGDMSELASWSSEYRDLASSRWDPWSRLQLLTVLVGVEWPGLASCGFQGDALPLAAALHGHGLLALALAWHRPPVELASLLPSSSGAWTGKLSVLRHG